MGLYRYIGAYRCIGVYRNMGVYWFGGCVDIWGPMYVHAYQLHLMEHVRNFLSLDHEPCSSPKYRNGGQKDTKMQECTPINTNQNNQTKKLMDVRELIKEEGIQAIYYDKSFNYYLHYLGKFYHYSQLNLLPGSNYFMQACVTLTERIVARRVLSIFVYRQTRKSAGKT